MEIDLDRVLDALPAMVWTALPDGRIDYVSRRWADYAGIGPDAAHGWGWQAAVNPDDLPQLLERWRSILASGKPGEMEARLRRFDGQYRWFRLHGSPMSDDAGRPLKWYGMNTDIEDQKRAEEALLASGREVRLVVDSIPGGIEVLSPSGEVEAVNEHVASYFGKTAEELTRNGIAGLVHPEDLQNVRDTALRSTTTGEPYDAEQRFVGADGKYRWFHVRGLPLRDANGRIVRWYALHIDIDDQKRAEEALRESERNLKLIIDTIPALAWSARPDGSAEFFNQHYLDYVGLSAEQAQGWGWTVAVHPDDMNGLAAAWQAALASGTSGEAEARMRRLDGEFRWFLFRVDPLRDETGTIAKWYGVNTDIEDRKRAEHELRRSEAFLADAQRLSRTGSFSWLVATEEVKWSDETYRIYEFDPAIPVTFDLIRTRVHPDNLPPLQEVMAQARREGGDFDYETRLLMPDQSVRYLRVVAHSDRNKDGELELRGAVQDVTERRLADEALSKLRSELAHVTRVTSLGAMTASIAHEVNQPLSGIITNASTCLRMLAADPPNIEGAQETARRTIRDGNRAADVITRLRTLFSKRSATIEPVDLNEAVREVIALSWVDLQRSRVVLRMELADGLARVGGDRVQLQQVIMNLLRNAADAMSGIDDRPRQLVVRTEPGEDDHVRLSVRDTGVGFAPDGAERLFEAFYTTKSEGMGMGLSVSRSIIERHNGRLWAQANDGPGATFSFSIPEYSGDDTAVHGDGAMRAPVASSAQSASGIS
jgi:PAS domain S-box-containing protein